MTSLFQATEGTLDSCETHTAISERNFKPWSLLTAKMIQWVLGVPIGVGITMRGSLCISHGWYSNQLEEQQTVVCTVADLGGGGGGGVRTPPQLWNKKKKKSFCLTIYIFLQKKSNMLMHANSTPPPPPPLHKSLDPPLCVAL